VKKPLLLLLLLSTLMLQAQKKNSLLWEISGNGLTKKSYLYGTMHVNEKISYHLSDSFYNNLLTADMIATESDPETWIEAYDLMKNNEINVASKFYTEFYLSPINKEKINTLFYFNNNYFTNILSGGNDSEADFQENTVLDTFIYQTGRKYKKKSLGLENAKDAMLSVLKISNNYDKDSKEKEANRQAISKIIKERNFNQVLNDFYREKNIIMLDSLYKLIYSKKSHGLFIVDRNKTMANSIDSLVKKGSLFSAIGAAHLAGKNGVIQLLQKKGYTVNPIFDSLTAKGLKIKKTIEDYFAPPNLIQAGSTDKMIQLPLNKLIIDKGTNLISPDYINGGSININRIPLNYFLKKENNTYNHKSLDSLFFEKIPGDIIEKKYIESDNFTGYDIKNKTKTGNSQHHRFYITPLEIISVTMNGAGDYVRQYEAEIFTKINLKPFKSIWEKITPAKGGFTVDVPYFNTIYGNTIAEPNNIEIQAYDNNSKAYYFVTERTLNNCAFLENSAFEQKQIHYEFYLQHKIKVADSKFDSSKNSYESNAIIGDKKIALKTFIKGDKYYLLGAVNGSIRDNETFFNSFVMKDFNYSYQPKTYIDSIAGYKIDIPEKENKKLFLALEPKKNDIKNIFVAKNESKTFISPSGKTVDFSYYKYPKYESAANIDSVKMGFKKLFLKDYGDYNTTEDEDYDYESGGANIFNQVLNAGGFKPSIWEDLLLEKNNKYEIISESESFDKEKNCHIYNALISKPNADQAIKYKVLFNEESQYTLNALVDKNYKNNDPFVEKTFDSFVLLKKNTSSVFDDKVSFFINDASSNKDTIRYSALNSAVDLKITKKDFNIISNFLNNFKFKASESETIDELIAKIGGIQDASVIPFLESFYKRGNTKNATQIAVLKALSNQKSKAGYQKIIELLEYDLPIPDKDYQISNLFYTFRQDIQNSKELFPKIFQFYSIKEYNKPIINFCNELCDKKLVSLKKINSYKKIITTNAKLEYKRILSWKESKNADNDGLAASEMENIEAVVDSVTAINSSIDIEEPTEYSFENSAPTDNLIIYINLLHHFSEDENIKELHEKIKSLNIVEIKVELLRLGIANNKLSNAEIEEALNNLQTRFITVQLLLNNNKKAMISLDDDAIAKSAIISLNNLAEKDKLTLLAKREGEKEGKKITFYFYELMDKSKNSVIENKKLLSVAFINDANRINPLAYDEYQIIKIKEDEDLEAKYDLIIKKMLNKNHSRANFEVKEKYNENELYEEF
jgi:uncharacterized protein YbaP (TraB family)